MRRSIRRIGKDYIRSVRCVTKSDKDVRDERLYHIASVLLGWVMLIVVALIIGLIANID